MTLILVVFFGFILGTILGSLALALAQRSLSDKTFGGRSICPHCHHKLAPADLVPLFSYLLLKARCRYCRQKISPEYPLVELVSGLTVALIFWQFVPALLLATGPQIQVDLLLDLLARLFIFTVLIVVAITDYKQTIIPDRITFPAIKVTLVYLLLMVGIQIWQLYQGLKQNPLGNFLIHQTDYFWRHSLYLSFPLWSGLATAVLVGLFFLTLIIITRGRGMGGGDLKLGVLIGLFFGYPLALAAILLSFLAGSVVAIGLILAGKKHFGQTIPFGPFLSIGSIVTLIWGAQIASFYSNLNLSNLSLLPQFMLK